MAETTRGRSATKELEAEVARLIAYLNDQVVPEVRRSSSLGLRAAAEQLHRMAEHLDRRARQAGEPGGPAAERAAEPGPASAQP